ncbi:hypothetical protein [Pedobacter endophyticus]|uniref:PH domain-containing protein n=1 Tax=Pedobacter endophyticus TaxID=2789740 RepID=A0A7S9KYM1_9SPHI|nr:hypothetical protein [Pedobacter endophyticus]QPH39279.1 hypothetical protein IZT61_19880 [Pedobacter endophyticus]
MEKTYRTKLIFHIKSLKFVLISSGVSFGVFYLILTSQQQSFNLNAFLLGALPLLLMFIAPAMYLHLTYYIKTFGQKLIVNESQNKLTVIEHGRRHCYNYSSIISIEQHLGLNYRNRIDRLGRRFTPWTPYGYITIKLDNGLRFQLTCLMIDIQNPPFVITHTYFRFFPYLKIQKEISEKRAAVTQNFENEVSHYKATFKNHTTRQLKEKLDNAKSYNKASVEASKQLLRNREAE